MAYAHSFTKREVINITTKNIIASLNATKTQAKNPNTSLQYDLDATSFGMLDLIINTWEDLELDIKTIPARHVGTVEDIIDLAMDALDATGRLSLKINAKGPGPYVLRGKHR